jgi:hypothetical protein
VLGEEGQWNRDILLRLHLHTPPLPPVALRGIFRHEGGMALALPMPQ